MDPLQLVEESGGPVAGLAVPEARGLEDGAEPEPWSENTSRIGEALSAVALTSWDLGLPPVNIDVYFSAGPRDANNPFGCSMRISRDSSSTAVCSLYRVRIRTSSFSPYSPGVGSVWRIKSASTGNRDRFQPDLLNEGTRETLAYVLRLHDEGKKHAIVAKDLTTAGRPYTQVTKSSGRGGLQFPAFYNTRHLTWSALVHRGGSGAGSDLWGIQVAMVGPSGSGMTHGSVHDLLGYGMPTDSRQDVTGGLPEDADFEDADRQPRSLPANGKRVMTMHSKARSGSTATGPAVPIVSKLSAKSGAALEYEPFNLGEDEGGDQVQECHHPTWGPLGDIVCHHHVGFQHGAVLVKPLYSYEKSSTTEKWGPGGSTDPVEPAVSAFPIPPISDLESLFREELLAALMVPDQDIRGVSFKYAKFTEDPDLIVTTIMVSDTQDLVTATKGFSRVLLVRRSDGQIWDLTRLVESFEGVSRGSMGAWAPTSDSPAVP